MCLRMGLFVFCLTYRIRSLMKLSVLHTLMYYLHVHEIDCYVYTLIAIDTLIYTLVKKEGEGERRAMLRMRIGLDFTTLGTLLLMPTLDLHSSCTGYIRLVWADTSGARRCSIYLVTTWRVLESIVCLACTILLLHC